MCVWLCVGVLVHTCLSLSFPLLPLKPQFLRSHIVHVPQTPNLSLVFRELFVEGKQISADETWQLITAVSSTDETPLRWKQRIGHLQLMSQNTNLLQSFFRMNIIELVSANGQNGQIPACFRKGWNNLTFINVGTCLSSFFMYQSCWHWEMFKKSITCEFFLCLWVLVDWLLNSSRLVRSFFCPSSLNLLFQF